MAAERQRWLYLETEALQSRVGLASWLLRDLPCLVEIGGTGVAATVTAPRRAVCVDPRAGNLPDVLVYPVTLDAWTPPALPDAYGLVLLGLSLRGMTPRAWDTLHVLVQGATRVVLEHAVEWALGVEQCASLVAGTAKATVLTIGLDYRENAVPADGHPPYLTRRLVVLE